MGEEFLKAVFISVIIGVAAYGGGAGFLLPFLGTMLIYVVCGWMNERAKREMTKEE